MTKDEIKDLVSDIWRVIEQRGVTPGSRSIVESMVNNALTVSRHKRNTVNSKEMLIESSSLVSSRTKEPIVRIQWGDMEGQISPGEARDFAERVRRTADAAESDGFVFHFMREKLEVDDDKAAMTMHLFREYREERARKDYLPPDESRIKEGRSE